jgi:NAD(P)-dependent dehydrogenase (short-subunit alcohol dehydrogenase family)
MLAGRIALVTGAARGLGAAIVRVFAAHGAVGAALDLAVPASAPPGWEGFAADVSSEDETAGAVGAAVERFGRLDILVANAGVVPPWSPIAELDVDALEHTLAVNVRGVAVTLKHGSRALSDGGAVILTASLNAWHAAPAQGAYTASKHAVLGLARTAALDLGPRGIRVNAIAPGPIATEALLERMERRAAAGGGSVADALADAAGETALGRMATEEDVANTALFLASGLAAGITGALIPVDGGIV